MPQGMWVAGGEERGNVAVAAVQEEETGKEINLIITVNKLLLLLYGKIMNHELSLVFVIDKCRAMHFVNSKTTRGGNSYTCEAQCKNSKSRSVSTSSHHHHCQIRKTAITRQVKRIENSVAVTLKLETFVRTRN